MIEGRREDDWHHTSRILCLLYNANKTKGSPAKAEDFHPCLLHEFTLPIETVTVAELGLAWGCQVHTVGQA